MAEVKRKIVLAEVLPTDSVCPTDYPGNYRVVKLTNMTDLSIRTYIKKAEVDALIEDGVKVIIG